VDIIIHLLKINKNGLSLMMKLWNKHNIKELKSKVLEVRKKIHNLSYKNIKTHIYFFTKRKTNITQKYKKIKINKSNNIFKNNYPTL